MDVHGSILEPGSQRAAGRTDDAAVVGAILRVEAAWAQCLAAGGVVTAEQAQTIEQTCERLAARAEGGTAVAPIVTAEAAEGTGNPVVPVVAALRAAVGEIDPAAAALVHRGLTSQDVVDTAMMLIAGEVVDRILADVRRTADGLAALAREHADTVMVGRTLTQPAVPITFGLKAASWLAGVLDAADAVARVRRRLPVQCGGAAGTLSLAGLLLPDPLDAAAELARRLDLADPGVPWHTVRTPVTGLGDALATTCAALGAFAADVTTLSRPEIGEVHEGAGPESAPRGGSSTMPHKRNPVLSVLIRSAAVRAPHLAATLHTAAGLAVDERPDGAWHAEWPTLQTLLTVTATAASQAAETAAQLEVDRARLTRNVTAFADALLAEPQRLPGAPAEPADYLGSASRLVQRILDRHAATDSGDPR